MLCNERITSDLLDRFQLGRASYELKLEESEVIRAKFTTASSPLYSCAHSSPVQLLSGAKATKELTAWKAQYPSILDHFDEFTKLLHRKRLAVFLDYDGTLTPIVKDPDQAFMSEQMRAAVRRVAGLFPTSIISGRGREKVEGFVQLKELFYAGSHGMDIVGPKAGSAPGDAQRLAFQPAARFAPIMDAVYSALVQRVKNIPGASVEHNKFCVSVHFRNCSPECYESVVTAVKDTLHDHPDLRASRGRKVLEIQPQVDWGKGRALSHMLKALSLADCDDVIPIYLGDDRTDEDAFKVLKAGATGFGILISNKVKETEAKYTLTDPSEVMAFLTRLVEWGITTDNAWHHHPSCTGWTLNQAPSPPTRPTPSTDRYAPFHSSNRNMSDALPNGVSLQHSGPDRLRTEPEMVSPAGSSAGHSPRLSSAFATVRHFHGLPVAAGISDRAMPASHWLTQTDNCSQPRHEAVYCIAQLPATNLIDSPAQQQQESPDSQPGLADDEYSQMACIHDSLQNSKQPAVEEAGADSIQAEGRPPTGEEEDSTPPSRASLDHYLQQPQIAVAADANDAKLSDGTAGFPIRKQQQPVIAHSTSTRLPDGKRLTALLLDKLQGHEGHLPLRQDNAEEVVSPPGDFGNDSESSLAGYQSPFESLANEVLSEEADSVRAEDGSVKSMNMAPSM